MKLNFKIEFKIITTAHENMREIKYICHNYFFLRLGKRSSYMSILQCLISFQPDVAAFVQMA